MKKFITITGVLSMLLLTACAQGPDEGQEEGAEGTLYIAITDASADLDAVTEVSLKISSAEIYSQSEGWISLDIENDDFDLLELKANSESKLLAKNTLNVAGNYNKMRLKLDSVNVKNTANIEEEATLLSEELEFDLGVKIDNNKSSYVEVDFMVTESLHVTEDNDAYVFAPVFRATSETDAMVSVDTSSTVTVSGGKMRDQIDLGVDVDGKLKIDFQLDEDATLKIMDGEVKIDSSAAGGGSVNVDIDGDEDGEDGGGADLGGGADVDGSVDVDGDVDVDGSADVDGGIDGSLY